jgi:hypothetical protein
MPHLANLRSLSSLKHHWKESSSFPLGLQELKCDCIRHPQAVVCLTKLTSLQISFDFEFDDNDMAFEALTALTALQRLVISCSAALMSSILNLPLLTHLYWLCDYRDSFDLEPFTRALKLVHLELEGVDLGPEDIRTIANIASLRSLRLPETSVPAVEADFLAPLSRLTNLKLDQSTEVGVLERVNLQGLQSLELEQRRPLGADDVSFLQQLTGLTRLRLCYYGLGPGSIGGARLFGAVSHMARLQEFKLSLRMDTLGGESCFEAIGLLKALTNLEWWGGQVSTSDVAEIARLTSLRVLSLEPKRRGPDGDDLDRFLALARLPQLMELWLGAHIWVYPALT